MAGGRLRLFSFRIAGVLKFLVAFSLGFITRYFLDIGQLELQTQTALEACSQVAKPADQLFDTDLHLQFREQFRPQTVNDVLRYDYFNMSGIYNNFDDLPRTGLLRHQKSDIKEMVHQAMALYNSAKHSPLKVEKLLNGYRRLDPLRGEEYVLDVVLRAEKEGLPSDRMREMRRFELLKPFMTAHLLHDRQIENHKMVHVVVTISADNYPKFDLFLQHYEKVCLRSNEHVYLLVILFMGSDGVGEKANEHVHSSITTLMHKYRKAHIRLIPTRKNFNRGMGLDLGIKQLPENTLVFLCDVDVVFSAEFLARCRQNSVFTQQVYYPMVFARYDPKLISKYTPPGYKTHLSEINQYTGHWVHSGHGMVCMYVLDYRSVGGFDQSLREWGQAGINLYEKHVHSNIKVFRAADPGLIHLYHPKSCNRITLPRFYNMCTNVAAEMIGSKQQLGQMMLEQMRTPNTLLP